MVSIRFAVRESHALLQSAMSPAPTSTAGLAAAAPAASGPGEGGPDGSSTQVASARDNTDRKAARRRTTRGTLVRFVSRNHSTFLPLGSPAPPGPVREGA